MQRLADFALAGPVEMYNDLNLIMNLNGYMSKVVTQTLQFYSASRLIIWRKAIIYMEMFMLLIGEEVLLLP